MSASSSGSWAGSSAGRAPANILDLDRFMRTARPSRSPSAAPRRGDKLVVDSGGGTGNSASSAQARDKRFSHDSGLSDGSYVRRRHRNHKRPGGGGPVPRAEGPLAAAGRRSLRAAFAYALRDQQAQLARVTHVCERLARRRADTASSSSRSTADLRRGDKLTDECKTYKLILTKLNELNHVYASRARASAPRGRVPPAPASSVSVSDKLVGTEPAPTSPARPASPAALKPKRVEAVEVAVGPSGGAGSWRAGRLVDCAVGDYSLDGPRCSSAVGSGVVASSLWRSEKNPTRHVRRRVPHLNTNSVVKWESSNEESNSSCGFDLVNPIHLYTQAKRLQALHASTHRTGRSGRSAEAAERSRGSSLCALCRGYAHAFGNFLATQLLCCPPRYSC